MPSEQMPPRREPVGNVCVIRDEGLNHWGRDHLPGPSRRAQAPGTIQHPRRGRGFRPPAALRAPQQHRPEIRPPRGRLPVLAEGTVRPIWEPDVR